MAGTNPRGSSCVRACSNYLFSIDEAGGLGLACLLAWKLETGPVPALSHALERPGVACVSSDADLQGPSLYSRLSNQQQPRPVRYCDLFGGSVLGFGWVRCPTRRFRRRTSSAGRRRCCCRLRSVLLLSSAVGSGGSTN